MSALSVFSGLAINDWVKKHEREEEDEKYKEELEIIEKDYIEDFSALGYLSKFDKAGYLRATSKARQTFKGLNPKDKYFGMVNYNKEKKRYEINFNFVAVVEVFYFEIKRGVSREEHKRNKYEFATRFYSLF